MLPTLFEKLDLKDERNVLVQGLPSTVEKQFSKISFSKNVTPLLRARKIDFALVFAVNECQLNGILKDVMPALQEDGKLWIAYPKPTSKIASDLNRDVSWKEMNHSGYEQDRQITLDHVWNALSFKRLEATAEVED